MATPEELDKPPAGWHPLNVMRKSSRKWDWVALMVDVDPDELKYCVCDFPALFFVNPSDYQPAEGRKAQQCLVRVSGKHQNADAAWEAIWEMIHASKH